MTRIRPETVIADDVVTVEPGQMAQTVLTVRNTGNEIAEYAVALVPDCVATGWTDVEPASFRLMPGRDQQVTLRFRPPLDSSTPAGSFPLGVMVTPEEAEHQSPAVAESDLAIGAFHALQAEVVPPRSRGRWRGRHIVKLTNKGTDDVRVRMAAPAEDEALSYALAPTTVAVPPRTTAEAFLRVRPKTPLVLGKPVDHPFEVTYRPRSDGRSPVPTAGLGAGAPGVTDGGETEAKLQGSFTQKPVLSRLVLVALALLVIVVALLLVFRPWEKPAPRRPPEPLANIQMISSTQDEVVVAWDNASNISEVGIREVDCGTAEDVLPTAVGEVTVVESSGSGRQSHTLGDLAPGEDHCFQARAVADGEASIWAPSPAARVALGQTAVPPSDVEAAHTEACTIEVNWTPVVPEGGDLVYQVAINGEASGDLVPGGGQMFEDQPPGEDLEVTVESVIPAAESADELRSEPSEPVMVTVPEGCDQEGDDDAGEDGDGGGGAGGAGGAGDDTGEGEDDDGDGRPDRPGGPPRLTGRFWLLFTEPVEPDADRNVWQTQWQAFGRDVGLFVPGQEEPQPRLGRVGVDVLLPEDLGEGLPGQPVIDLGDEILYVDLYGDDEAQARDDCAQMNRLWASFPDMQENFLPCRLVHPNGDVDDVLPAS